MNELEQLRVQLYGMTMGMSGIQGKVRAQHNQLKIQNDALVKAKEQRRKDSKLVEDLLRELYNLRVERGCVFSFEEWRKIWFYVRAFNA